MKLILLAIFSIFHNFYIVTSILLSASATVLLYTASIDIRNRASRSSLVKQWRSEYLAALDDEDIDDISEK